jgi:hypothetical protein
MLEWPRKLTDALAALLAEDGLELKSVELLEPGAYRIRIGSQPAVASCEQAGQPAEQADTWGRLEGRTWD